MAVQSFNPFRSRATEQQRDTAGFVRTFGPGMLELLPDSLWDRLFVLRSAPGGGKTSLLRLMTYDSLALIHDRRDDFPRLAGSLEKIGALTPQGPAYLGVLINLGRDYRSLLDVGASPEAAVRLFLRLLDSRVMTAVVRAAVFAAGLNYPDDAGSVVFKSHRPVYETEEITAKLGGSRGNEILAAAREAETEITRLLESLLPVRWEEVSGGHSELYCLSFLSDVHIHVAGRELSSRPLLLLDDGQDLAPAQRAALLGQLVSREATTPRWYAERLEALGSQELVGQTEGRDYLLLELEAVARTASSNRVRGGRKQFERYLLEIADLRASRTLERMADADTPFSDLLRVRDDERLGPGGPGIIETVSSRVRSMTAGQNRYDVLIHQAERLRGYAAAVKWRQVEIAIEVDKAHPMTPLFDFPLEEQEIAVSSGMRARDAAELFLAHEFGLPYYAGPDMVARLASQNVDQFLAVCGDLFEEMLAETVLNRRPHVSAARQHQLIVAASERMWRELTTRVPHGHDVQRLLLGVVDFAHKDTFRPTAPYAPGATGTAIRMRERDQLIDAASREAVSGGERFVQALGSAIAFNVLSAEADRRVKGDHFMVLYLNRLLLPRVWLPLGRGGFREKPLHELIRLLDVETRRGQEALTKSMDLIP